MKIILLAGFAPSLLNFRRELLQSFVRAGHTVIAVAPGIERSVAHELFRMGIKACSISLNRTGMNPLADIATWRTLRQMFRDEAPQILLSYTVKPVIFGSLAARAAGVPHIFSIVTGLGYAFQRETLKQRLVEFLVRPLYRRALSCNERVFFQNPDDLRDFSHWSILSADARTTVIDGSGVNLERFTSAPPVSDPVRFLIAARLYREKGICEFLEAARTVKNRYPDTRFTVVGSADSNPSSLKVGELGAWVDEGIIEHSGWVDDVRPHMCGASVYVLPSYREGTPRSVLEAMAMAKPIVTTDVPGCRETVIDGHNGFLVAPKNASALASAMEKFVRNPKLIGAMGQRSREIAEKKYDVFKINAILLKQMGIGDLLAPAPVETKADEC